MEDVEQACGTSSKESSRRRSILPEETLLKSQREDDRHQFSSKVELPLSPRSRGLPVSLANSKETHEPRLVHPFLNKVPLQFRFGFNGILSNVCFMIAYNYAVAQFSHQYASSTIYSVVYFVFIPLGHALVSLLVFGWPERYIASLMSNFPIGLTALGLGGALTAYLDRIEFNENIAGWIRDYSTFSTMPARSRVDDQGEFYSSLVVLFVTGVWTYVLSVYINSPPEKSEKKEL
jgi:hypothetical protein